MQLAEGRGDARPAACSTEPDHEPLDDQLKDALARLRARSADQPRRRSLASTALTPAQAWGDRDRARGHAARNREVSPRSKPTRRRTVTPRRSTAAKGAAAIMGMNNVYYRFLHFMGDGLEYATMPARLRMQVIGNPGIDKLDFELACLAARRSHGCEACVRVARARARGRGGTQESGAGRGADRGRGHRRRGRASVGKNPRTSGHGQCSADLRREGVIDAHPELEAERRLAEGGEGSTRSHASSMENRRSRFSAFFRSGAGSRRTSIRCSITRMALRRWEATSLPMTTQPAGRASRSAHR